MAWSKKLWSVSSHLVLKSQYRPQQPGQEQVLGRQLGHVPSPPPGQGQLAGFGRLAGVWRVF